VVGYGTVPWPSVRGYGTLLTVRFLPTHKHALLNDLGKVIRRPRSLQMDQPKREDVRRKAQVVLYLFTMVVVTVWSYYIWPIP
jgi:hypothetical protein